METKPEQTSLGSVQATCSLDPEGAHFPLPGPAAPPSYLMVFEGESCARVPLPAEGEFLIGRAKEAQLRLRSPAVSRLHLKLLLGPAGAQVVDLSRHGTLRNGEPLRGDRALCAGDLISFCGVHLVFHREAPPVPAGCAVVSEQRLRQRLPEEIERARRFRRPLALLHLELAGEPVPGGLASLIEILRGELLSVDQLAPCAGTHLLVLLPEREAAEAQRLAQRLSVAARAGGAEARVGLATCPADGADGDTLLLAARAAARADVTTLRIGEQSIVVADAVMVRLYELLRQLGRSELPVLLRGETGSGKEIAASALHSFSPRRAGRFVPINCAALPEALAEGLLFGHERGAFSGAVAARPGLLEGAEGGTVFLDEVAELSLLVQAKLLRVLETRRVLRLGELQERPLDFRLVAATHRDLEAEVRAGRFREDLYFRLCAAAVVLPPLRERRRELPLLAQHFLAEAAARQGRGRMGIGPSALHALLAYPWPGNLRELKNTMDYLAATSPEAVVQPWHLPERIDRLRPPPGAPAHEDLAGAGDAAPPAFRPLDEEIRELERTRIVQALEAADGVQTRAAELIGMPRRTFLTKCKLYGLLPRRGAAEGEP